MMRGRPVSTAHLVWMPVVLAVVLFLISGLLWKVARMIHGDSGPSPEHNAEIMASTAQFGSTRHPPKSPGKPPTNKHPAQVRLDRIIIPVIDFEDTTVEEAIDFLRLRVRELDQFEPAPEKSGISFVIRKPRLEGTSLEDEELEAETGLRSVDPGSKRISSFKARNSSAWKALHRIAEETGFAIHITDYALVLTPTGTSPEPNLKSQSAPSAHAREAGP